MSTDTPEQHRPSPHHRLHRLLATVAVASAAAVVLAACGGSSKSTASSAANGAGTTQNASRANRFASLQTCLQKEGINLPSAPAGGAPGNGGPPGAGGGGFKLPEGVSRAKFQEALKKCGGRGFPGRGRRFNSATARTALTRYAACMRENGVNLPTPNTSGNGPVFNTKGIDTSSAAFKKARQKCQSDLKGAFGARGGPPAGGAGGPPAGPEGGSPAGPPATDGSASG